VLGIQKVLASGGTGIPYAADGCSGREGWTTERFCGLLCKNLVVLNEHLLVKLGQSAAVTLPIPDGTLIELCQRNIDVGRKWKRQYEKGLLELYESVR